MDGIKNIISLIGMTGAGKSSVGIEAAQRLGYSFFDLDALIEEGENEKIPLIFSTRGEEEFREIEYKYLAGILTGEHNGGVVLSCGGGIVCLKKNVKLLVNNSYVVWIKRDICDIINDKGVLDRPPHNGNPDIYLANYKKRETLYEEAADFVIVNKLIPQSADELVKKFRSEK